MWKNIAEPLIGRVGTAIGFTLMGWGIADAHANVIGIGVATAFFVAVDLLTRRLGKN